MLYDIHVGVRYVDVFGPIWGNYITAEKVLPCATKINKKRVDQNFIKYHLIKGCQTTLTLYTIIPKRGIT